MSYSHDMHDANGNMDNNKTKGMMSQCKSCGDYHTDDMPHATV